MLEEILIYLQGDRKQFKCQQVFLNPKLHFLQISLFLSKILSFSCHVRASGVQELFVESFNDSCDDVDLIDCLPFLLNYRFLTPDPT